METPLSNEMLVRNALAASTRYLSVDDLVRSIGPGIGAKDVENALKALAGTGQIEVIPRTGRNPAHYGLLASAKPVVPSEPKAVPIEDPTLTDEAPAPPAEADDGDPNPVVDAKLPATGVPPIAGYLLVVPKKKPRKIRDLERAEEAALAAVRNGAKRADVFALIPIGSARRGAEWTYN